MNEENLDSHTERARMEQGARAKNSAVGHVDLDALVREGKRLHCSKDKGMTEHNLVAFKLFSQAAEAGHVEAQYYLGLCYLNGDDIQQDNAKALTWLERSAGAGFEKAMLLLGALYQFGKRFPKNEAEAIKLFRRAADAGSLPACELLTMIYRDRKDAHGELRWNKEAALRGCFDSLWSVRTFYECKEGVEMDLVEAYAWLSLYEDTFTRRKLSRELWSFQLGPNISEYKTSSLDLIPQMSASRVGQARQLYRDLIKHRVKWIRKKAEEGSRTAQFELGWCYRVGYGASPDNAEAVRWWQMAAEQGDTMAQNNLGHSYYMGLGVTQDYNVGAKWMRMSAQADDTMAQSNMGYLCKNGYGVPRDNAQALAWYRFAAAQGDVNAQEEADKLEISICPMELERANQLYRGLKDKKCL
jgi:hypothetical protein